MIEQANIPAYPVTWCLPYRHPSHQEIIGGLKRNPEFRRILKKALNSEYVHKPIGDEVE